MADSIADQTEDLLVVADLFSKCINCFGFYQATKDYGSELVTLLVQLDFEKARLLKWAEHIGLLKISSKRHEIDVERLLEPSITNALASIKLLLTGADQDQAKFGLHHQLEKDIPAPPYALELAPIPEFVSRNSMTVFRTNYARFCAKYDTILPRPALVTQVRWLIHDCAKFDGLINTLKEIVDDLFSLLDLEKSVHEEAIELDILSNNNFRELRLIEDAAKASSYPVFARAASIAIDRTENDIADNTTTYLQAAMGTGATSQILSADQVRRKIDCKHGIVHGD
jgi:hypothetical protein